jgi:outer membrane protein TolC
MLKLILVLALVGFGSFAFAFTPAEFEAKVIEQNTEVRVLSERRKALMNAAEEAELIYGWQFVGGLNQRWDKKPRVDPSFTYDSLNTSGLQLGLQKQFSWGLESKLSLDTLQTEIVGGRAGPAVFDIQVWETTPTLELKFPLAAGGFGRKVRADYHSLLIQKKIEALNAENEYQQKMNEALTILWSTVLQREALNDRQETLARVQKIFQIVRNKTSQNLEASSNFLLARSAVEQTELELQSAQLRYDQLERLLNLVMRQMSGVKVPAYDFTKFQPIALSQVQNKVTAGEKLAVLSEKLQTEVAVSRREELGARLDVVASLTANGQNDKLAESFSQSQRLKYPTSFVGLQWVVPLESGVIRRAQERQDLIARLANERQQYFQTEQKAVLKEDLVSQYNQSVKLLAMNLKLEKTQAEKLKNERQLLTQGRSSIYQVLQYELDLGRAQAGKFLLALDLEKLQQEILLNKYENYE